MSSTGVGGFGYCCCATVILRTHIRRKTWYFMLPYRVIITWMPRIGALYKVIKQLEILDSKDRRILLERIGHYRHGHISGFGRILAVLYQSWLNFVALLDGGDLGPLALQASVCTIIAHWPILLTLRGRQTAISHNHLHTRPKGGS